MGGETANLDIKQFAITMWVNPEAPTPNGPVFSLFRVSMNVADVIPTSTEGVRLALYLHTDSANFFNRGMRFGYAETPSSYESTTDLS